MVQVLTRVPRNDKTDRRSERGRLVIVWLEGRGPRRGIDTRRRCFGAISSAQEQPFGRTSVMTELALIPRDIPFPSYRRLPRPTQVAKRGRSGWVLVAACVLMISAWIGLADAVPSSVTTGIGTSVSAAMPAPPPAP
jgi:hypothetical protein